MSTITFTKTSPPDWLLAGVFHGKVTMTFDDASIAPVMPTMTHFFYMDEAEPSKVGRWVGSVGPIAF